MSTIWQKTNLSRSSLTQDIKLLLNTAGAVDWLGPKEAPVLLKPNLVVSKPASGGATTHPEIAAGIIEYLIDCGFSNIAIAEGSWVGDSTTRAFKVCGWETLSKKYGIKLIDLQEDDFEIRRTAAGDEYKICGTIAALESSGGTLINLPVLKGHGQTHLTCALKNLKGCIPDSEKRRYHSLGVHQPVAMLNTITKPAFTLVDGLNGDPYWEEGGSPEKRDLLLLGRDSVSIDSYACRLLGIEESDVSYIGLAESLGVGETATDVDIISLDDDEKGRGHRQDTTQTETKTWISSLVDQRSACSACFGNLAGALRELKEEAPAAADALREGSICIGQDFKGTQLPPEKIGIGVCTSGRNCLKGCPPSQAAVEHFLEAGFKDNNSSD